MTTVKEFTPVLMYVDHERIEAAVKSAKEFESRINSRARAAEEFLKSKLSDEEIEQLANEGIRFVDEKLQEQFQFKNATKEFNLEAMGLTDKYQEIKKILMHCSGISAYDFEIKDGAANLSEKGKKKIIETNTHYTKNEAQNRAFKLAEKLVRDLNKAKDNNWISTYDVEQIRRGIKITNYDSGKFVPDYQNISYLNSEGQLMSGY